VAYAQRVTVPSNNPCEQWHRDISCACSHGDCFEDRMKNAREMPKVMVRMDPEVKDRLMEAAQRNFRSLTNEIYARLVESLATKNEKAPNA
jgi:predicted HicB family RNase H-like nuclease